MRAKHTPGPWHVRTIDESIGSIDAADGSAVAQAQMRGTLTSHNHEERRANTRLIAAAPDLLEALEAAETYLVERGVDIRGVTGRTIVLPKMQSAIAKATGKESAE